MYRVTYKGDSEELFQACRDNKLGHVRVCVVNYNRYFNTTYADVSISGNRDFFALVNWFCKDTKFLLYTEHSNEYDRALQANPQYWSKLVEEKTANTINSGDVDSTAGMIEG